MPLDDNRVYVTGNSYWQSRNAQLLDQNILVHGYMYEDSQSLPSISFHLYIRDVTHEFIKHVQKHAILLC